MNAGPKGWLKPVLHLATAAILVWLVLDVLSILRMMDAGVDRVRLDTGRYYLVIVGLWWLFVGLERFADSGERALSFIRQKGNMILIGGFVFLIACGGAVPIALERQFVDRGYEICGDPREVSRVSPGQKLVFSLSGCGE